MIKIIKFLPSLFFLFIWALIVTRGLDMKRAINNAPITSNQFIATMGRAIDNPWTHNNALQLFFIRLRQEGAPPLIWVDSLPFGWELWNQYQFSGSIKIMLIIAHESGNRLEEQYWARKYIAIHPGDPQARRVIEKLRSLPPGELPAEMHLGK